MVEKFLTAQEIADILKIKKTTVYEMIKRNELPSSKIGKQIRIRETDFQNYLTTNSLTTVYTPSQTTSSILPNADSASDTVSTNSLFNNTESSLLKQDYLKKLSGLIISGSNPIIDLLCAHIESEPEGLPVLRSSQNSYNSLYSLYFEKIHATSIAFGSKNRNTAYIQRLVPGVDVVRIHLAKTTYGIYTANNNPLNIHSISDLCYKDVRFVNQEKGSTSRILLDVFLNRSQLSAEQITGYHKDMLSDLSCATAVMSNRADAAIGSTFALQQFPSLNFIPFEKVDFELIFNKTYLDHPAFQMLIQIIQSDFFKAEIGNIYGCDCSHTGEIY